MIVYFLMGSVSSYLLGLYTKNKKNKIFLILSFLPFFLILGLRYGIGYDYLHIYTPIFNNIVNGGKTNWEIGAVAICKLIGIFTKDPFYFFFITSFITSFVTYKAINENSEIPWLSLLLFVLAGFYMESMNIVRQSIAISIFIYSYKYIYDKNLKKYIISIIIASLFHESAIILLPIYFICNMKLTKRKLFLTFLGIMIILPIANTIFMQILKFSQYSHYMVGTYSEINPTYSELIISSIIFLFLTTFKIKEDKMYNILYIMSFIFFAVSILSFKIILAYRLVMYFKISLIFSIPKAISKIENKKNRVLFILLFIVMFSGITLIGAYKYNWYDTKYISIFDK